MKTNDTMFDNFLQEAVERDLVSAGGAMTLSYDGTCRKIEQKRAADSQRQKIVMRVVMTVVLALIVTNILLIASGGPDISGADDNGYISESTSYFTDILQ